MIWKQKGKLYLRVSGLQLFHCPGSKAVKPAIVPYDELPHPKFCDMALYFRQQCRVNGIQSISMANEKAGLTGCTHIITPFELF